jgi:hypothetical protein
LLAWEVDDEALRDLHFLTVASYNLQHRAAFTDAAYAGLRDAFLGYLEGRLTIADIRRRAAAIDGTTRIRRRACDLQPRHVDWPMTIGSVAAPGQAARASDRVRAWAEAIRMTLTR